MTYDKTSTIDTFVTAAAAKQATPGGGSVTALVGALAASMGEMVVNYSIGKKDLQEHLPTLKPALAEFGNARQMLLALMAEDQDAYAALSAARKLPEGSAQRNEQYAPALVASIRVPQAVGAAAVEILELADSLVDIVNFFLLSDLAVCADLAMATARCAIYNVRVNLSDVTDPTERINVESTNMQLLSRGAMAIQRVSPRIWARHSAGA